MKSKNLILIDMNSPPAPLCFAKRGDQFSMFLYFFVLNRVIWLKVNI